MHLHWSLHIPRSPHCQDFLPIQFDQNRYILWIEIIMITCRKQVPVVDPFIIIWHINKYLGLPLSTRYTVLLLVVHLMLNPFFIVSHRREATSLAHHDAQQWFGIILRFSSVISLFTYTWYLYLHMPQECQILTSVTFSYYFSKRNYIFLLHLYFSWNQTHFILIYVKNTIFIHLSKV